MKIKKSIEEIRKEVKEIQIGMFSTLNRNEIQSRPMAVQDMDEENSVWFFTHTEDSYDKIDEIRGNANVQISMVDLNNQLYYSINGKASVITDQEKIDKYWSIVAQAWFPDGKRDPGLVLLKVDTTRIAWWDSHSSKLKMVYEIAKAIVTESKYNSGEHQAIKL